MFDYHENPCSGAEFNRIRDFDDSEDIIDLSLMLQTYSDPLTDAISDFLAITDNGTHTYVSMDYDGTGNEENAQFGTLVMLEDYTGHGNSVHDLVNDGALVVV